jgi:hypothetical protein
MLDQTLGTADRAAHGGDASGGWGLAKLPVVSDSGYGDVIEFRLGLTGPPTGPALPQRADQPDRAGARRGTACAAAGDLAPRLPQECSQPDRGDALAIHGTADPPGQP